MHTILLVDDDIELTALLRDILELEGFTILEAHNGEEGLAALTPQVDLILLDVMMPKMNGMDMLRKLREKSTQPVLMLTAKGEEIDRVLGLELGADDYLPKPFSARELLARIRAILRRANITQTTQNHSLHHHDIEISSARQEVTCQGQAIAMTGTEFSLLHYLIQHAGQIVSKNTLSQEVLGKPLAPFDRAIDMHLSNLRKKLPERVDEKPRVKTLRGKGYIWIDEA